MVIFNCFLFLWWIVGSENISLEQRQEEQQQNKIEQKLYRVLRWTVYIDTKCNL